MTEQEKANALDWLNDLANNTPEEEWQLCYSWSETKINATNALALLKEQKEQIKNRDESLEKAREEIRWLRGMMKEQEAVVRCKYCNRRGTYDCPIYVGGDADHGSPDDWFCGDGIRKKE